VGKLVEDASLCENMNGAAIRLNAILEKIDKREGSWNAHHDWSPMNCARLKEISTLAKDMKNIRRNTFHSACLALVRIQVHYPRWTSLLVYEGHGERGGFQDSDTSSVEGKDRSCNPVIIS
jgi:hypothetical protein